MKILLKLLGIASLVVVAAVTWLVLRKPAQRPVTSLRIEATPERLARGKYLVENVSDCLGCHSDHLTTYGFPIKPGTEGQGGFAFDKKLGVPGVVAAQNITSDPETGLGKWSDDEILRAMREGVDRNGDALFPMMPYKHLRAMSDEDAKSVVAYIRTLKPIRNQTPKKKIDFPVNLIIKFEPKPVTEPVSAPDPKKDHIGYGRYLAKMGGCLECHTPHNDKQQLDETRLFAGGWEMRGPWGRVITANLTPHPDSYIGRATREEFIGRFRAFAALDATNAPVAQKGRNTVMPWLAFSKMTDEDLGAIYDYLKTLQPVANKVNMFPDAASGGV
jgi:mono/diheme cytochrome c family protein